MRKLSDSAVRVLTVIAEGNIVTGIRGDLTQELQGLVGAAVPCLPNFVLTKEGVTEIEERGIVVHPLNMPVWNTLPTEFTARA